MARRKVRSEPSAIRISDWDDKTVVCDLCGGSWNFETPEQARSWMWSHKGTHR